MVLRVSVGEDVVMGPSVSCRQYTCYHDHLREYTDRRLCNLTSCLWIYSSTPELHAYADNPFVPYTPYVAAQEYTEYTQVASFSFDFGITIIIRARLDQPAFFYKTLSVHTIHLAAICSHQIPDFSIPSTGDGDSFVRGGFAFNGVGFGLFSSFRSSIFLSAAHIYGISDLAFMVAWSSDHVPGMQTEHRRIWLATLLTSLRGYRQAVVV